MEETIVLTLTPSRMETSGSESARNPDGSQGDNQEGLVELAENNAEDCQMHPLLLPPVMERVFSNMSLDKLAQCRLVCSQWLQASIPIWRATSTVSWVGQDMDTLPLGAWSTSQFVERFKEFLDFLEEESNECDLKPFHQFNFKYWRFGVTSDESASPKLAPLEDERLWPRAGAHITSLVLQHCSFTGVGEVRKVMYLACPNLQQLEMELCEFRRSDHVWDILYRYDPDQAEPEPYEEPTFGEHFQMKTLTLRNCLPDSWLSILSHFAWLTTLTIHGERMWDNLNPMDTYLTQHLLKSVSVIRARDNRKLPLEHVAPLTLDYTHDPASRDSFQLLQNFEFPLGQMRASLKSHLDHVNLRSILLSHATTLKELVVDVRNPPPFRFPDGATFESLEILRIRYGFATDFHFLNSMPNLKILDVSYPYKNQNPDETMLIHPMFANTLEEEMSGLKLTKLEELEIRYEMSEASLRRMVGWIPNLQKLKMPLDDILFGIVCENWTSLVELRDSSDKLTDAGLTRRIPNPAGGDDDSGPIIGQLQRLVTIITLSSKLTGVSVRHGFLKLQNLTSLAIHPESHIGIDWEKALTANGVTIRYRPEQDVDSDEGDMEEHMDHGRYLALDDWDQPGRITLTFNFGRVRTIKADRNSN